MKFSSRDITQIMDDFGGKQLITATSFGSEDWQISTALRHRTAQIFEVSLTAAQKGHIPTLEYLNQLGINFGLELGGGSAISTAAAYGQEAAFIYLKDQPGVDLRTADKPSEELVTRLSLIELAKANGFPELAQKIEGWMMEARIGDAARGRTVTKGFPKLENQ